MSKRDVILTAIMNKVCEQIQLVEKSETYNGLIEETINRILDCSDSWDLYKEYLAAKSKKRDLEKQLENTKGFISHLGSTLSERIWGDKYTYRASDIENYLKTDAKKQIEDMDHPVTRRLKALQEVSQNANLTIALATTSKQMSEAFNGLLEKIGITKEDLFR